MKLRSGTTYPYGFGWSVDDFSGQRRYHHGGAWQGFKTYISRHLEDDLTVIVLANLSAVDPGELVDGVAALFNPTLAARTKAIADREPVVTERARRLISAAEEGKLTAEELAYVRAGFFPGTAKAYEETLKGAGRLVRLDLLEAQAMGDDRVYRYRAAFQKGTFLLVFGLAPDGRVSTFGLRRRDDFP